MANFIRVVVLIFFYSTNSWAWNAEDTHRDLSEKAAEKSVLSLDKGDYLKNNLGFDKNLDTTFTLNEDSETVRYWIRLGSLDEDEGNFFNGRYYNHFHDPTKAWNEAGLNTIYPGIKGESSILWAQDSSNDWSWKKVRDYYYDALTAQPETERSGNFANTFKGLGHIIHLIQDTSQPAHVRNDAHPLDDMGVMPGFEYWAWAHRDNVKNMALNSVPPTFSLNNALITQFFDTDQYNGTNPSTSLTLGLAEYTNANFASEDTITSFPYPRLADMQYYEEPYSTWGQFQTYRKYYRKTGGGEQIEHFVNAGRLTKYLDTYTVLQTNTLGLDDKVYSDYAQKLVPRAVGYSAGLLNYFFRGKVNMEKDPQNAGKYIIKNEASEKMEGNFALYYDDTLGNRNAVSGASWNLTINPNSTSSPVTFAEPTSPTPKEKGKYILVFNGKLGMEEGAVVGREVKLKETVDARLVKVNNNYGSRGNITVYTKNGTITGQLPSAGLGNVRAVRFDADDWNTFVVMAIYSDWVDPNHGCPNGCYEFHKYTIDESALTLNYQGVILKEEPISERGETREKIYEDFNYDLSACDPSVVEWNENCGWGQRVYKVQENGRSVSYVDFFLKGGNIKPFGTISEESYSWLSNNYYQVFSSDENEWLGIWGESLGKLYHLKSSKLYYGGVVQEKTPYNCQGGYYYFGNQGFPGLVACQPQEPQDTYFVPLAVFNSSDYAYALYQYQLTGYSWGMPQYSSSLTNVVSTLPIAMPQDLKNNTYLKTMLSEDGKYSFYNNYPSKYRKSYSSEIGVANCSGFLLTDKQVDGGYLGWKNSGEIVNFKSCSDWKSLATGYYGGDVFDVILK